MFFQKNKKKKEGKYTDVNEQERLTEALSVNQPVFLSRHSRLKTLMQIICQQDFNTTIVHANVKPMNTCSKKHSISV